MGTLQKEIGISSLNKWKKMTDWIKDCTDECYTCKEDTSLNEDSQCKVCYEKGLVACYQCSNVGVEKDYNDAEDGDWLCNECYQPTCQNCNEEVDEDGKWCSKECYDEYFSE